VSWGRKASRGPQHVARHRPPRPILNAVQMEKLFLLFKPQQPPSPIFCPFFIQIFINILGSCAEANLMGKLSRERIAVHADSSAKVGPSKNDAADINFVLGTAAIIELS
jgi:hypothetical protein